MLKRSYFWHQAQVCMSLARACNDPILKERYEDLALNFAQKTGREQDLDSANSYLFGVKSGEPDSDDTSPQN
jgi:hypothetical protein